MKIIKTKKELKEAQENNLSEFKVVGKLAKDLHKASKIKKLSKTAVISLASAVGVAAATAPFTGGASIAAVAAASPVVAGGISTGVIVSAIAVGGLLLVYALYNEYTIKLKRNTEGDLELVFTKKENAD